MTETVYVEKITVENDSKCSCDGCNTIATYNVVRTENGGKTRCIVETCDKHKLLIYQCAVNYMFKIKTKRLIAIAQGHGLHDPKHILQYLAQQGIEDITLEEVNKILRN